MLLIASFKNSPLSTGMMTLNIGELIGLLYPHNLPPRREWPQCRGRGLASALERAARDWPVAQTCTRLPRQFETSSLALRRATLPPGLLQKSNYVFLSLREAAKSICNRQRASFAPASIRAGT